MTPKGIMHDFINFADFADFTFSNFRGDLVSRIFKLHNFSGYLVSRIFQKFSEMSIFWILFRVIYSDFANIGLVSNFRGDLISQKPVFKILAGIEFCGFRGHFACEIKSPRNLIPVKINPFKVVLSVRPPET